MAGGYELHLADKDDNRGIANRTSAGGNDYSRLVTPTQAAGSGATGLDDAVLAAYGPWWRNFRASVSLDGGGPASGMVFRLGGAGCYFLLVSGTDKSKDVSFKLVKKVFWNDSSNTSVQWAPHITYCYRLFSIPQAAQPRTRAAAKAGGTPAPLAMRLSNNWNPARSSRACSPPLPPTSCNRPS